MLHSHPGAVLWGAQLLPRILRGFEGELSASNPHLTTRLEAAFREFRDDTLDSLEVLTLQQALDDLRARVVAVIVPNATAQAFEADLSAAFLTAAQSGADAFDGLFAACAEATRSAYETYGVAHPAGVPAVRLTTISSAIPVHRLSGKPGVSASCPTRQIGVPLQVVELRIEMREMDFAACRAIPYLLFHELVSHAFEGPASTVGASPSESDPFAEGWMDAVALTIHDLVMNGLGPEGHYRERFGDPPAYLAGGHAYQRMRIESPRDENSRYRRQGVFAFEALRSVLRLGLGQDPNAAFDRALEISLRLNASDWPLARRRALTRLVRLSSPESANSAFRADLEQALKDYFAGGGNLAPLLRFSNR